MKASGRVTSKEISALKAETELRSCARHGLGYLKMKTLTNLVMIALVSISASVLSSCTNEKAKEVLWDSGPIENMAPGGTDVGKVSVYTIDWLEYTKKRADEQYRVYKKSNGDYVIDYNGGNFLLKKADEPFGESIYALKWKIDYNILRMYRPAGNIT